jgi:F0F1-type ATP synthase epsilon subunit
MGILAQHVPSIEQLKPGLVEVIEESGGSKQFFRTSRICGGRKDGTSHMEENSKNRG